MVKPRWLLLSLVLLGEFDTPALAIGVLQETRQFPGNTSEGLRQRAPVVLASELDPDLPAIPIADWIRDVVKPDGEVLWVQTACPATHERWDGQVSDRPVCVYTKVGRWAKPGVERPQAAVKPVLLATISIRLGRGNPNSGAWQLERPQLEDAFIETGRDSVTVPRLAELPRFFNLAPERWPKSELSIASGDIRCDKTTPTPGERVRCQATLHNRGPVEAVARVYASIVTAGDDIGRGQSIPNQRIPAGSQVVVAWDWVWPPGSVWSIGVSLELVTPHAYGGYRIPIRERNTQDNRAYVAVPARR